MYDSKLECSRKLGAALHEHEIDNIWTSELPKFK